DKARGKRHSCKSEEGLGDFTFLYTDWFYCVHLLSSVCQFSQGNFKNTLLGLNSAQATFFHPQTYRTMLIFVTFVFADNDFRYNLFWSLKLHRFKIKIFFQPCLQ
ncbi:hypothetical protein MEN24_16910, partial [Dolichospermum sp. ST_sed10]|nr:hypothetical protein [Dolichospermum sp. ST_sed10]